jgi:hypothetical protein
MFLLDGKNIDELKKLFEKKDRYSLSKNVLLDIIEYCFDLGYDQGNVKGFREGTKETINENRVEEMIEDAYKNGYDEGFKNGCRKNGYKVQNY